VSVPEFVRRAEQSDDAFPNQFRQREPTIRVRPGDGRYQAQVVLDELASCLFESRLRRSYLDDTRCLFIRLDPAKMTRTCPEHDSSVKLRTIQIRKTIRADILVEFTLPERGKAGF
jgi:hypothetical protein